MSREYENEIPIDDAMVVLDLLTPKSFGGKHGMSYEIIRTFENAKGRFHEEHPYVEIGWHPDFGDSRYFRFKVTSRVCDELLGRGLVRGKPEWGYTNMDQLRVSAAGEHHLWEERRRLELDDRIRSDWWFEGRG